MIDHNTSPSLAHPATKRHAGDSDPLAPLHHGGKVALARALAQIERAPTAAATLALLDAAWTQPRGHALGLTGPPGVGKSTLLSALIEKFRHRGETVGVIAVDPSSRHSGGALLGDRTRLTVDPEDMGVFVRSMAARDRLGGLAALTQAGLVLMRALFDRVIIETVGVGQSETEIVSVADAVLFCVQPGSGDSLQFMKAGIVEIPDIAIVSKADMGAAAERAMLDLESALGVGATGTPPPTVAVSAETGQGMDALLSAIESVEAAQSASLPEKRARQATEWVRESISDRHGRAGLERLTTAGGPNIFEAGDRPFAHMAALDTALDHANSVPQL